LVATGLQEFYSSFGAIQMIAVPVWRMMTPIM